MNETEKQTRRSGWLGLQIGLPLICLIFGGMLVLFPDLDAKLICTAVCLLLLLAGLLSILSFFVRKGYQVLRDYSFSLGILLLALGGSGLARLDTLAGSFLTAGGFLSLAVSVILLQCAVQLTVLNHRTNLLVFIFALASLFGSITVITGFRLVLDAIPDLPQITLLLSGSFGLLGLLLTGLAIRSDVKKRRAAAEAQQQEQTPASEPEPKPESEAPAPDTSAVQEEVQPESTEV